MNRSLLFKWMWRFKTQPDALWVRIIKAIHDTNGYCDQPPHHGKSSTWTAYVHANLGVREDGKWAAKFITIGSKRGAENTQMEYLSQALNSVKLRDEPDRWIWELDVTGCFSVASRLALNKLPTKLNMSLRGMELSSISCPICNSNVESTEHLFFSCHVAWDITRKIFTWWGLLDTLFPSYQDWLLWINSLKIRKVVKDYLEATFLIT
ncbi:RNA-directed DNA polymerase, eukaryota [Tanacetum coccineum]